MPTTRRPVRIDARCALAGAFCLLGLLLPTAASASGDAAEEGTAIYGAGVTLEETTPIADLLADPDAYLGRRVRVEGRVTDVCPKAGCWMELAAAGDRMPAGEEGAEGPTLRIKVEDGVIVFPADAHGRAAVAEGVVEAVEMSREQYVGWLVHLAEERGEQVDTAQIDPGEGPFRLIRLRGLGAEIAAGDAG